MVEYVASIESNTGLFLLIILARGNFCHLLITFVNSSDPDQHRENIGPGLDPHHLTLVVFLNFFFFLKLVLKKAS